MDLLLDRWIHVVAGIAWIGLLYYFNLVQVPSVAQAKANSIAADIVPKVIAPRALLWFRWAAVVTWVSGAYYLYATVGFMNAFLLKGSAATIGLGAWLGTIMLFNVWVLIWPNQKKVLGMVEASDADKARAARVAFLASRTNTMLSIPMAFFMVAGGHWPTLSF
jgi:uncharacterized membrane protein